MVSAEREHELALFGPAEPGGERESAGEPDRREQQPRVVRELRLDEDDTLLRRDPGEQSELDRDERHLRPGQRHPGQAEQRELEPVADLDGDDRDAVDERERREGQPGGEPERPALGGEERPQLLQLGHRVAGAGGGVERLDERVVAELADRSVG